MRVVLSRRRQQSAGFVQNVVGCSGREARVERAVRDGVVVPCLERFAAGVVRGDVVGVGVFLVAVVRVAEVRVDGMHGLGRDGPS